MRQLTFPIGFAVLVGLLVSSAARAPSARRDHQVLVWNSQGSPIEAGHPTILCFDVQQSSSHTQSRSVLYPLRLRPLHSRLLHIAFMPATYSSVLHVHVEDYPTLFHAYLTSGHCAAVNVTLPSAGRWVVGVNLWPVDEPDMVTVSAVIDVAGRPTIADFPVATRPLQVVQPLPLQRGQSHTAAVQRSQHTLPHNGAVLVNVQLDSDKRPVKANDCCPLALSVSDAATHQPVVDLLPLLSLPAHLLLFHYNHSTNHHSFQHIHAHTSHHPAAAHCPADHTHGMAAMMDGQRMADVGGMDGMNGMVMSGTGGEERFGPMVEAAGVKFDCAGRWMIVGQMRRAGSMNETTESELLTVMMDVMVV